MPLSSNNLIKWFADISIDDIPQVGGKNASLGERFTIDTETGLEWAKDGITGELFFVQARPKKVQSRRDLPPKTPKLDARYFGYRKEPKEHTNRLNNDDPVLPLPLRELTFARLVNRISVTGNQRQYTQGK